MVADREVEQVRPSETPMTVAMVEDTQGIDLGEEPSGPWWDEEPDEPAEVGSPEPVSVIGAEGNDGPVESPGPVPEGSGEGTAGEQAVRDATVSREDEPDTETSRGAGANGSGGVRPEMLQNLKVELLQVEARLFDRLGDLGKGLKAMQSAVERNHDGDGEGLKPIVEGLKEIAAGLEDSRQGLATKVEDVAAKQKEIPDVLGRFQGPVEALDELVRDVADELRKYRKDVEQWRHPKTRAGGWQLSVAVVVVMLSLGVYGGMSVQQQFSLLEIPDESGGWREYIWDSYGRAIVECATEARRQGQEIECRVAVTAP